MLTGSKIETFMDISESCKFDYTVEYDFICSLGGSCATGTQLKQRNLANASMPFNWIFHNETTLFDSLAQGFSVDFKDWLQKENIIELSAEERGNSHLFQYKDKLTGYRYIHDFKKDINSKGMYEEVKSKYDRRFKRFLNAINQSQKVLFVLDCKFKVDLEKARNFINTVSAKYPDKVFDLIIISFSQKEEDFMLKDGNITLYSYQRDRNAYEYRSTNIEWIFLEYVSLSEKLKYNQTLKNLVEIGKIKKNFQFYILPGIKTSILRFTLTLFSFTFDFCIGKVKNRIYRKE